MFKKKPVVIDKQEIISSIDQVKELIVFCEQHHVDELTIGQLTIKRSVHLLPEPKDDKKKNPISDLVGWSSD